MVQILWLVGLFPQMKHSTDQRAHRPTSSPPLRSNLQLYLTRNVNNLIYFFPRPRFRSPTDSAQTHRGRRAPPFSYLCLQEMWATQHSIKTIFCTIDPTTLRSPFFCSFLFLFLLPPVLLRGNLFSWLCCCLNREVNVTRWRRFTKSSGAGGRWGDLDNPWRWNK